MADFQIPDFLQNCDVDTIHKKMMSMLPKDIDKTEGGFPWDFTRPTALIAAELLQFYAVEILKLVFIQYSHGIYLDMLCEMLQVKRKAASKATAVLTITGGTGTYIPGGTVFCTESHNGIPSIEFTSDEPLTIGPTGTILLDVTAVLPGPESNVDANTITLMSSPINGIESVTNAAKATGGTEAEDDESLRERAMEVTRNNDTSFIGNDADYKRWAESVDGMGTAVVVSEWDGPETVKIVCIDANGEAASQTILDAIYDYIMSPDEPLKRLAPPNTILTVAPPALVTISYSVKIVLEDDFDLADVVDSFKEALDEYYKSVANDGMVMYTRVSTILAGVDGVYDFCDLTVNGDTRNVAIDADEYPTTGTVSATSIDEGDVG